MPTERDVEYAIEQIDELEHGVYRREDESIIRVRSAPANDAVFWSEMTPDQQLAVLNTEVEFRGFSAEQSLNVIQNVMDGKDRFHWMDGIDRAEIGQAIPDQPSPEEIALAQFERNLSSMKREPEIVLESTRHYVMPDPEDAESVYDTCDTIGPWDSLKETEKLRVLEAEFDWRNIGDAAKETVLAREVDYGKISRAELNAVFDDIRSDGIDERPARRLFDEANYEKAVAEHEQHGDFDQQMAMIRDTARNLIEAIMVDSWPRAGAIVDYGIDSQEHYESLYHAIRNGEIAPMVLDAAMGNGARLGELVREAPSNPHKDIQFHTSWDEILGRERPEANTLGVAMEAVGNPSLPASIRAMESEYHRELDRAADAGKYIKRGDKEIER